LRSSIRAVWAYLVLTVRRQFPKGRSRDAGRLLRHSGADARWLVDRYAIRSIRQCGLQRRWRGEEVGWYGPAHSLQAGSIARRRSVGTSRQRADGSFRITATVDCIRSHSGVSSRYSSIQLYISGSRQIGCERRNHLQQLRPRGSRADAAWIARPPPVPRPLWEVELVFRHYKTSM
jgi:hypothetical protein